MGQAEGSREVEIRSRVSGILEKRAYEEGGEVKAPEQPEKSTGEVVDLLALLGEVGAEAVLEAVGGPIDDVGAEANPDQDADRQGEEDGRQRRGVVAPRIAHQSPNPTLILSQSRSKTSPRAGELTITITITGNDGAVSAPVFVVPSGRLVSGVVVVDGSEGRHAATVTRIAAGAPSTLPSRSLGLAMPVLAVVAIANGGLS